MDREALRVAWTRHYARFSRDEAIGLITERASALEEQMRALARYPDRMYKGFVKRTLESALGMSLGVHKQLLWRLTSAPLGGNLEGGGRV